MNVLVVGSRFEAYWAMVALSEVSEVERIFHLRPSDAVSVPPEVLIAPRVVAPLSLLGQGRGTVEVSKCVVRDRWGKQVLQLDLPALEARDFSSQLRAEAKKIQTLPEGVDLARTSVVDDGLELGLSDGSEVVCALAIFADGQNSRCRAFVGPPEHPAGDPATVGCWTFRRSDLLNLRQWDYRWSLGKTVEQVPLPNDQVRVKFRFRSPYGARLKISDLKSTFSEFGSDMEALFDNVSEEQIEFTYERDPELLTFFPARRCFALGRSAWGSGILETFDWEMDFVGRQLKILTEALGRETWDEARVAEQCQKEWERSSKAERFLRSALHYDNVLLRPLRDLLVTAIPNNLLSKHLRPRLLL